VIRSFFLLSLIITGSLQADLAQVRAEPNLEKRSELALDYANTAIDQAKKAYEEATPQFPEHIQEVRQAVELSYESLQNTGKAARRSPKYFKRAEMRIRSLLKRLDNLEQQVSVDDREPIQAARKRISEVHEQVLLDIMSKK